MTARMTNLSAIRAPRENRDPTANKGSKPLSALELDIVVQAMRLTQIVPYTPAARDGMI
jgi:hypothetical protein